MDAEITGKNDERFGLYVQDNADVEHWLEMEFDGEIQHHDQDPYPRFAVEQDADDVIRLREAQEYCKYHVLHERGYPTLEPRHTPAWLALGLGAIARLDAEAFERHFGEILQQYHSWIRPGVEPIVEVPEEGTLGGVVFRADVYLGLDFAEYVEHPDRVSPIPDVADVTEPSDLQRVLGDHAAALAEGELVEAVSDIEVFYQVQHDDGSIEETTVGERTSDIDRPADLRIELLGPDSTLQADLPAPALTEILLHHLQCQVRDAYLRAGMEPPPAFRLLGQGLFEQTKAYEFGTIHPRYHVTDAEIEGYRTPTEGLEIPGGGSPLSPNAEGPSITRVLKEALFGE